MKIGIYSPYLDTVGGGERYMLTIAEALSKKNTVNVFLDSHLQTLNINNIIDKNTALLNLDLEKVGFVKAPFGRGSSFFSRSKFLRQYDLLFYLTDGSIFYSTAKKSILHIQSPIKVLNNSLWKKVKKSSWSLVIYNSEFTKETSEKYWKLPSKVVYPPVDIKSFKSGKKRNQIITVGRFFGYLRDKQSLLSSKKHEVMINAFKNMVDSKLSDDWEFHLVGGAGESDMEYVKELKGKSSGYPIFFHTNLPFLKLKEMYSESAIYWHAAGFEETDPTKMEHFGITTVEAMASGVVPVVINLGGQKEIIQNGENGFLWEELKELQEKTAELIKDDSLRKRMSEKAIKGTAKFSKEEFIKNIENLI